MSTVFLHFFKLFLKKFADTKYCVFVRQPPQFCNYQPNFVCFLLGIIIIHILQSLSISFLKFFCSFFLARACACAYRVRIRVYNIRGTKKTKACEKSAGFTQKIYRFFLVFLFFCRFFFKQDNKWQCNATNYIAQNTQKNICCNSARNLAKKVEVKHICNRVVKATKYKHNDWQQNAN